MQNTPAITTISDGHHQVVIGVYTTELCWNIHSGINLYDTDTYEYCDKYGTLYITNKKTGQEYEIFYHYERNDDLKHSNRLCLDEEEDGEEE
jgi:hypothetical protein